MSIRPVDMQIAIPKTVEVSNQTQGQQQRMQFEQQQFSAMAQHKTQQSTQIVNSPPKTEEGKIREKPKREDAKREKRSVQEKRKNANSRSTMNELSEHSIDIRI